MNRQAQTVFMNWSWRSLILMSLTALAFSWLPAEKAQSAESDKIGLSLGVFVTSRNTDTRVDGAVPNSGTPIDVEGDLGFDKSDSVFRLDGYYRFNDKHRIDFSWFDLSRSATKQIQREIEYNGTIYPVDALIEANLDLQIYKLAYTYSLIRRESGYLGLSAGLYVADIGTSLAAQSLALASSGGVTAPLPVVGIRGQYDFSEKWSARGSAEIFAFEYGDFSGSLHDLYAGLDYQLFENTALGVGYNSVSMNLGVSKPNLNGDLDWRYGGALLFFRVSF
jgi:hypothetical protein